jgi:hypothetical protein
MAETTTHLLQRRRARRRRARGAVFVESIIVISMLMLMLAGGLFFHRLYSMKLKAVREARLAAWTPALRGCPTGLGFPAVAGAVWNSVESLANCDSINGAGCVVQGLSTSGTTDPPDWMGTSGASMPDAVRYEVRNDSKLGGRSFAVSSQNRVACNETPQHESGDIWSLVDYAHDSFWPKNCCKP